VTPVKLSIRSVPRPPCVGGASRSRARAACWAASSRRRPCGVCSDVRGSSRRGPRPPTGRGRSGSPTSRASRRTAVPTAHWLQRHLRPRAPVGTPVRAVGRLPLPWPSVRLRAAAPLSPIHLLAPAADHDPLIRSTALRRAEDPRSPRHRRQGAAHSQTPKRPTTCASAEVHSRSTRPPPDTCRNVSTATRPTRPSSGRFCG
jgi:hypothetical protein